MTAVQVCRRWREVGENPILWPSLRLPTVNQSNLEAISNLLTYSKRLQTLDALVVRSVSEVLLFAVAQHKNLKRLDIANTDLSSHLAPRRADYEQAFTGVNLKTDIISGTLFNISGILFRAPETIKSSGTLFRRFGPIY